MTEALWVDIDRYIEEKLLGADPVLAAALEASDAAGLPQIAVSPAQGKLLNLLALSIRAERILEVGTLGGYSTIWLARALPASGKLISLELDARHAEVARANLERAGQADKVDIWIGAALDLLPKVSAAGVGPFDLAFLDADKANIPDYVDWAMKLSRPGGLIVIDNTIRHGALIDADSGSADVQGVRRMHDMLAADKRVAATSIQTVGVKGHDGFTIAVVNAP